MEKVLTASDVKETRIALAFFGGVALAVYESGVAHEFFRLVRGEGVYAKLRQKVGPVVVDIITGTSAGGLNGACLANAIVNRGDMVRLMNMWLEEGDMGKLLWGPFKSSPQSLLDGEYFRRKIFEVLMARRSTPAEERFLQPSLDLYITATNLDGDRVVIKTPAGKEIATRTHRQIFRFQYQQKDPRDDSHQINDFKTEEDICRLAQAARASASFPFAFEPVLVEKNDLGLRAQWLEADAYHMDGGVLDNKPIAKALEAIAEKRADKLVHRLLFYIEPDPEEVESRVCRIAPQKYSPAEVVLKALIELPGYQSITSALQQIEHHNRNVSALQRTLGHYETAAARFRSSEGEERRKQRKRYRSPDDGPTALFRAQEDGYLDLRLERDVSPLVLRFLSQLSDPTTSPSHEASSLRELTPLAENMGNALKPTLYAIKRKLLESLDLKYSRRMCRYLVQVVRTLYPSLETLDALGGTGPEREVRKSLLEATGKLNALKEFLYEQEERIARLEKSEKDRIKAFNAEVESWLQTLCEQTRSLRLSLGGETGDLLADLALEASSDPHWRREWTGFWRMVAERDANVSQALQQMFENLEFSEDVGGRSREEVEVHFRSVLEAIQEAQTLASETYEKIRKKELVIRREEFCQGLMDTIHQKISSDARELERLIERKGSVDAELKAFGERIVQGMWMLRDALDNFYLRDMIIYPLMQTEELAGELQQIHFARISPADADQFLPGLSAHEKVAGEKFAHFGGFFSRKWRGNDLTWGRLDTAEIIIRKLLPGAQHEFERRELIKEAHREIIEEMTSLGMGIYNEAEGRQPERKDLIGLEGISAIPASDKIDWGFRSLLTSLKIGRNAWAETRVAGYLPQVTVVFDWILSVFSAVVFALCRIGHRVFRGRIIGYLLLAILFMVIGIILWNYSLHDLWMKLMGGSQGGISPGVPASPSSWLPLPAWMPLMGRPHLSKDRRT